MSRPTIAWSYSRLNSFKTCPKRYFHTSIAKDVKEDYGEAADWGSKVHKALERRLTIGAMLPSNMVQYERAALLVEGMAERIGGQIICEQQLALDAKLKPCDWFAKETWVRSISDVTILAGNQAISVDWKTGKRKEGDMQLALQAAVTFRHYPQVDKVASAFCWLKEGGDMDHVTFSRSNEPRLWKQVLPLVREMTDAAEMGEWPAKPSGLCQNYCPVNTCKFNGAYNAHKKGDLT